MLTFSVRDSLVVWDAAAPTSSRPGPPKPSPVPSRSRVCRRKLWVPAVKLLENVSLMSVSHPVRSSAVIS